ncbi:MAG: hypothetical protein V3W44_09955 [Dehalococcoidales bacterium]
MEIRVTLFDETQHGPEANVWTVAFEVEGDVESLKYFVKDAARHIMPAAEYLGFKK